MILRSIELEEFGKFRGRTFELRHGMNLVLGPNEAGKSTLVEAIPAVLFGCRDVSRLKPWGKNACAARLVFEGGGQTVEVHRDLLSDDVHLIERDDLYQVVTEFRERVPLRGRGVAAKRYRNLLARLLGIGDEELFRATCFFGHTPQEWRGDELSRKLRELLGGGSQKDYEQIMESLLEEHFSLTRYSPWGRDKQQDRQLEILDRELAERQPQTAGEVTAETVDPDDTAARIRRLDEEIARDQAEYDKGVRYVEQVRARTAAQPQPAPATTPPPVSAASGDHAPLPDRLRAAGLPESLSPQTPELLGEAAAIRQELAELQQPLSRLQQQEKGLKKPPWLLLGSLALLLIVAVLAVLFTGLPVWSLLLPAGALLALLGFGGWRQWTYGKGRSICDQERDRLEKQRAAALARQELLSERCEALGLPTAPIDLVRLQKLVAQHRDLLQEFWSGTEPAGSTERQPEPAEPQPSVASEQAVDTGSGLQAYDDGPGDATELAELERRLAEFGQQLHDRRAELARLQAGLPSGPVSGNTDSELQALKVRRQEIAVRVAVLRQAIELLAEAVERYAKSDLLQLIEDASRLFSKVTRDRYPEIRLDTRMHPELRVDDKRWQPVECFSRGTVDALYLALRVALARVRGDGRSLPLILDDPFAHLDQQRFAGALNMVNLAAVQGQLILLSHNQELARRAARERWHVVALDPGSPDQTAMEETDHDGQLHLL
ncbi:MAG: AAA family ATPase [Desulfuromonadales bacterium]|nr:AAA family ATPase [Desulfuromonadales bacterium]